MDELTLDFNETKHRMVVQQCQDIHELREIAAALVSCHYAHKRMLQHYMLESLPSMKS